MNPHTNNWKQRRTEHRFYAEIVTDIKTENSERSFLCIIKLNKKNNRLIKIKRNVLFVLITRQQLT
jgi:hypothetical protein